MFLMKLKKVKIRGFIVDIIIYNKPLSRLKESG